MDTGNGRSQDPLEVTETPSAGASRLFASIGVGGLDVFLGAFLGTYLFDGRSVLASLGISTVCAFAYVVLVTVCCALMAHRVKKKRLAAEQPVTKRESYVIGEREYYPVRVTAPVMREILEAQRGFETDQHASPSFMFGTTAPSLDQRVAMVESLYKQISILLVDKNGQHPQVEHLEVYLEVDQATDLLTELLYG